jgi:hypothetical protein
MTVPWHISACMLQAALEGWPVECAPAGRGPGPWRCSSHCTPPAWNPAPCAAPHSPAAPCTPACRPHLSLGSFQTAVVSPLWPSVSHGDLVSKTWKRCYDSGLPCPHSKLEPVHSTAPFRCCDGYLCSCHTRWTGARCVSKCISRHRHGAGRHLSEGAKMLFGGAHAQLIELGNVGLATEAVRKDTLAFMDPQPHAAHCIPESRWRHPAHPLRTRA